MDHTVSVSACTALGCTVYALSCKGTGRNETRSPQPHEANQLTICCQSISLHCAPKFSHIALTSVHCAVIERGPGRDMSPAHSPT